MIFGDEGVVRHAIVRTLIVIDGHVIFSINTLNCFHDKVISRKYRNVYYESAKLRLTQLILQTFIESPFNI